MISRVGNGNPLHSLAWKIAQTEEPGRLQSIGSQRVDITEGPNMHTAELQCCVRFRQQLSDLVIHIPLYPPPPQIPF